MAYFRKVKAGWRVEVERNGVRSSGTFRTRAEGAGWASKIEAEIGAMKRGAYPRKTLGDAIDRYLREVTPGKRGKRAETLRLEALVREFKHLAGLQLVDVDTPQLATWRDARAALVTPGTVQREINLLRNLFTVARDEWRWCGHAPFVGLRMPGQNAPRTRRVLPAEVRIICRSLGYVTGRVRTKQQEVAIAFLIGLRTGMRASEILSLSDATVSLTDRVASVPHKMQYLTGRPRQLPLTRPGVRLLSYLAGRGKFFTVSAGSLDALFRKVRDRTLIADLHFHDSRAEALTRLARKVDVMTLARISGHKDLRVLLDTYYRESAADIAGRLR